MQYFETYESILIVFLFLNSLKGIRSRVISREFHSNGSAKNIGLEELTRNRYVDVPPRYIVRVSGMPKCVVVAAISSYPFYEARVRVPYVCKRDAVYALCDREGRKYREASE